MRRAFLTPKEYLARFTGLIKHGPPMPSQAAMIEADRKHRFEMTLAAAAIRNANGQLKEPLRMRFDDGCTDAESCSRPCSSCALSMETAYVVAVGQCKACRQDLCKACIEGHESGCHHLRDLTALREVTAADASTDDTSGSDSDISIE